MSYASSNVGSSASLNFSIAFSGGLIKRGTAFFSYYSQKAIPACYPNSYKTNTFTIVLCVSRNDISKSAQNHCIFSCFAL